MTKLTHSQIIVLSGAARPIAGSRRSFAVSAHAALTEAAVVSSSAP